MILTTNKFLTKVKQRAAMTTNQIGLSDQEMLDIATDEMLLNVVKEIMIKHEGHLVYEELRALVPNQTLYRLPERALGSRLRHIFIQDSNANRYSLAKHEAEDLELLDVLVSDNPDGFIIEGNNIRMTPNMGTNPSFFIVLQYYFRPNDLTEETNAKQITSFDTGAKTITVPSTPSVFTTSVQYDIINNKSGNEIIQYDMTATDITSNVITFSDTFDSNIANNMWISVAKTSPVPMIVEEAHLLLVEKTIQRIAQMRNHEVAYKLSEKRIVEILDALETVIDDRVVSKHSTVVGRNPGLYRNQRDGRRNYLP